MKRFLDWSIRSKLKGLFLAVAAIAALTIALPMSVFDFFGLRRSMASDMATLADTLARNSTGALTFRDVKSAEDILEALRAEPSVTASCIYTADGKPFASYVRDTKVSFIPPLAETPASRFSGGRLIQFRNIVLDRETVGTIYVESDLQKLDARLREYTIVLGGTVVVSLLVSVSIASRLQRPISSPLARLVAAARKISTANDYSIRAHVPSRDEFGVLGSTFNRMLEQIEKRDQELRQHRERLEQEVASRTRELLCANVQLRTAEEKYRAIFEDAVVGIFQLTPEGRPLSVNRALAQMHGFDTAEEYLEAVATVPGQLFVDPHLYEDIQRVLNEEGLIRGAEIEMFGRDRSRKWVLANIRAVRNAEGKITLYEGTIEDVTDRKVAEERVQYLAYYDALTTLPNRTLLQDRLTKALAGARRREEKIALLFLDLDHFKTINDSLGHTIGDLLLQNVADRLKQWARAQDTVARIGGDEFLVVLTALHDPSDAALAADRVMSVMATEFIVQGRSFAVGCSIGISVYPEHGTDGETLIKNADAAMYCAKDSGRSAYRFFTEEMNAEVIERLTLENGMRLALDNKELFLVYQPQMEISSGTVVGFEALLRWRHPELGLIPPDRFIRVAENSGLIIPIGEWVLEMACLTARKWQEECRLPVPVAVNVSAIQFRKDDFHEVVARILERTRLDPQYLELELTESLLLSNAEATLRALQELKSMGLKLAIDDFGTGYSSLSYLRQFPVHKLKIDRSFIRTVPANSDDAAIASAIISLAKNLNLRVIAEGVESEDQLAFLRAHQCDEIQGYYFSAPLTAEEVAEKLSQSAFSVPASKAAQASHAGA